MRIPRTHQSTFSCAQGHLIVPWSSATSPSEKNEFFYPFCSHRTLKKKYGYSICYMHTITGIKICIRFCDISLSSCVMVRKKSKSITSVPKEELNRQKVCYYSLLLRQEEEPSFSASSKFAYSYTTNAGNRDNLKLATSTEAYRSISGCEKESSLLQLWQEPPAFRVAPPRASKRVHLVVFDQDHLLQPVIWVYAHVCL